MTPARHLALGLLLTAAAGMIDVVGFIELGGFYTSFMSGNTTQLGAGLMAPSLHLLLPAALVLMFFLGSFAGGYLSMIGERAGPTAVLGFVLSVMLLTFVLHLVGVPPYFALLPLALGAGAQNAVMPQRGAARLGTTFVSGTLYAAGLDLARAVRRQAPAFRWVQHVFVWFALLAGALIGAVAYHAMGLVALAVPGAIYALFLVGQLVLTNPGVIARL